MASRTVIDRCRANLGLAQIADCAGPVGRSLECRIVVDHDGAICRRVQVEFDFLKRHPRSGFEACRCAVAKLQGAAAMRCNTCH